MLQFGLFVASVAPWHHSRNQNRTCPQNTDGRRGKIGNIGYIVDSQRLGWQHNRQHSGNRWQHAAAVEEFDHGFHGFHGWPDRSWKTGLTAKYADHANLESSQMDCKNKTIRAKPGRTGQELDDGARFHRAVKSSRSTVHHVAGLLAKMGLGRTSCLGHNPARSTKRREKEDECGNFKGWPNHLGFRLGQRLHRQPAAKLLITEARRFGG